MRMSVRQLKSALEGYPDNAIVLVDGYEGGLSEIASIKETKVKLDVHNEDWNGPHDEVPGADVPAVILRRGPNPSASSKP